MLLPFVFLIATGLAASAQERAPPAVQQCLSASGIMHPIRNGRETLPDARIALPACRSLQNLASTSPPVVRFAVGRALMLSGDGRDVQAGLSLIREAANAGLPQAQYRMGDLYDSGFFKRLEPCSDFNECRARDRGHGAAAVRFFALAAPKYAPAASAMGYAYYYGAHGVRRNLPLAAENLAIASAAGITAAMRLLGAMHISGDGVPQDKVRGIELVGLAAQMGDQQSQVMMGDYALRGEGIQPNRDLAVAWYRKATQNGSTIAADKLRQLGVREWTAGQALLAITVAGIVLMTLTPDGPEGRARAEQALRGPDCEFPWERFDAYSCIHWDSQVIVPR
jgi:TPR repeat protein